MRFRMATILVAFVLSLVAAPLAAFAVLEHCEGGTYPNGTHVPAGQVDALAICIPTQQSVGSAQDATPDDAKGWFPGSTSVEKSSEGQNGGREVFAFIIKYPAVQRINNPAGLAEVDGAFYGPGAGFDSDHLVWRPLSDEAILASGKHLEAGVPKPDVSPPAPDQKPDVSPPQPQAFNYPVNAQAIADMLNAKLLGGSDPVTASEIGHAGGTLWAYGGDPITFDVPDGMWIDNNGRRYMPGQRVPTTASFSIWVNDP